MVHSSIILHHHARLLFSLSCRVFLSLSHPFSLYSSPSPNTTAASLPHARALALARHVVIFYVIACLVWPRRNPVWKDHLHSPRILS